MSDKFSVSATGIAITSQSGENLNPCKTFQKANHSTDGGDDNYNYSQKIHGPPAGVINQNLGQNNYFFQNQKKQSLPNNQNQSIKTSMNIESLLGESFGINNNDLETQNIN